MTPEVPAMSRIVPPDDECLAPGVREIYAAEADRFGAPLNTTKVWARRPDLLAAYRGWSQAFAAAATAVPAPLKYLVYVRVATLNGCPF
jgi:alkylhydroperoxidase family enzyme